MNYFVFSNYVNAWSIKKGLEDLGIELYSLSDDFGILKKTEKYLNKGDYLFFTEENNLLKYFDLKEYRFYPKHITKDILDDKLLFAEYLVRAEEKPIPYWSNINSIKDYPIYLKSRHSWMNDIKLPRGYILQSEKDFINAIKDIENKKLNREYFFLQKLLKSPIENNISVSGFFDYKNFVRNLFIVSKKVLGNSEKISTGTIIETIEDPNNLINRTEYILNKLKYTGPFELEFFYEEYDNEYYVLELNPRFWMQHGIFIDYYNNGVIKRYLDIDDESDWEKSKYNYKHIYWINGISHWISLIKRNKDYIKKYNDIIKLKEEGEAYVSIYPNLKISLLYCAKGFFRKVSSIIMKKLMGEYYGKFDNNQELN